MEGIKNVIFDMGGVLLNIDFSKSNEAFKQLGVQNFDEYITLTTISDIFIQLETGKITPEEFCNRFRSLTNIQATNDEIFGAWNALLLDFPLARFEWLKSIKDKYKIYLFSNTNKIHYDEFIKIFSDAFHEDFESYFIKAYYSHTMQLRKPNKDSFEFIIKEQNFKPEETLFIDDTFKNIEGAKEAGLQTFWLKPGLEVWDIGL